MGGQAPRPTSTWVRLDAVTGTLLNLNDSARAPESVPLSQWLDRDAAAEKARAALARLAPDLDPASLRPDPAPEVISNLLRPAYAFARQRQVDGIPVANDRVTIQIAARDGRVQYFSRAWHAGVKLPEAEANITPDAVRQRVVEELGLLPVYTDRSRTGLNPSRGLSTRLVVQPNLMSGVTMDALTGAWVDQQGREVADPRRFADVETLLSLGDRAVPPVPRRQAPLSAEEAKEIASDALASLGLAEGWQADASGRGMSAGSGYVQRTISVRFTPPGAEPFRGYPGVQREEIQVSVDQDTGEIRSLNARSTGQMAADPDQDGPPDESPGLDSAAAEQKARAYLAALAGDKAETVALERLPAGYTLLGDAAAGHQFRFARLHRGAPVEGQWITVQLDAAGQLLRYQLQWHAVTFPDLAADLNAVSSKFREALPVELVYQLPMDPDRPGRAMDEARLVYRLGGLRGAALWEVAPARWADPDGRAADVGAGEATARFAGHWAEKTLSLAAAAGLVSESEPFDPDGAVSRATALRWLTSVVGSRPVPEADSGFLDVTPGHPDADAVILARQLGWLDSSPIFAPDDPATRGQVAIWLARATGFARLLQMSNRITSAAPDLPDGPPGQALAMAEGFGWVKGDSQGRLRPDAAITYAELATLVLRVAPDLAGW